MRMILGILSVSALTIILGFGGLAGGQQPAAQKEVTIKGEMTCAACGLKLKDQMSCAAVIVEKKDGKEVVYFFDDEAQKKYGHSFCAAAKDGSVTGTIMEKDGKKTIKIKEVTFDKK